MRGHNGIPLLKKEWASIFTTRKFRVSFAAVMLIPLLYAGMFLYTFWDPYARLDAVPVAVVNEDKGATLNGEQLTIGDELVEKLKENKKFEWEFVSRKEANDGMDAQKYYAMIEIPSDFSKRATTVLDENPEQLDLKVSLNEAHNFLASQIGETGVTVISTELSKTITETYVDTILNGIGTLTDGLSEAADGSQELSDGAVKLDDGAKTLEEKLALYRDKMLEFQTGVGTLQNGSSNLEQGANDLNQGLNQLNDGLNQLVNGSDATYKGTESVAAGISSIQDGTAQLQSNVPTLKKASGELLLGSLELSKETENFTKGATEVNQGMQALSQGITDVKNQLDVAMADLPEQQKIKLLGALKLLETESQKLSAGAEQVANGATALGDATKKLANGTTEFATGAEKFSAGLTSLNDGAAKLSAGTGELLIGQKQLNEGLLTYQKSFTQALAGSDRLSAGTQQITDGMNTASSSVGQLADAADQLHTGSQDLKSGMATLAEGADKLSSGLKDGVAEAEDVSLSDKATAMIADPVALEVKKVNDVPNYGTGFAPYFMSLGLFVGALVLSVVFPFKESAGTPLSGTSWFFSKFQVILGVGFIQSVLVMLFVLFVLGLEVANVPLFMLSTFITSMAFLALIQFLVTWFGDPGRFIAILFLILQLTSCAGTFPIETAPDFLQFMNPILPMTYSVFALKSAISIGSISFVFMNVGVLLLWTVVCSLLTWVYFNIKHKKTYGLATPHTPEVHA